MRAKIKVAGALATSLLGAAVGILLPWAGTEAAAAPATEVDGSTLLRAWADIQSEIDPGGPSGLAGASLSTDGRSLTVFWAGSQPAALATLSDQHQGATTVSIRQVPYDQEEIGVRARSLVRKASAADIPVTVVSSTADFTGLRAYVDPSATAAQRAQLRALGAAEVEEKARLRPLSRYADTSPFWGGSVIKSGSSYCSTGFAVRTASGTRGMTTDQHCGANRDWITPYDAVVGRSNGGHTVTDSMVITGRDYSPYTYILGWDSGNGRSYAAKANVALNQAVCAGGGMSGEVCGARVTAVNVYDDHGRGPGYLAARDTTIGLAGEGDSGGPGYSRSVATGNLTLHGAIVSATILEKTACAGGKSNPWNVDVRMCFWEVFFTNQSAIASGLGVTILTAP
ncbi:MAG TPA: hypothetical protein VES42_02200 [Pilimelia sp.]|nr:hypothetical protein [Pilimelia sp.]